MKKVLASLMGISALAMMVAVSAPAASADGGDDVDIRIRADEDLGLLSAGLFGTGLMGSGFLGNGLLSSFLGNNLFGANPLLNSFGIPGTLEVMNHVVSIPTPVSSVFSTNPIVPSMTPMATPIL